MRTGIKKRLKKGPNKTYLLIFAVASHGMVLDGAQIVLINEYDPKTGFFKIWAIEYDIRRLAKDNTNAYIIGLMACCREMFSSQKHSGLFGGTEQQVLVHFDMK